MKVLYIGHYKDGTGWGDAAKNNIIALNRAGVDVVPRAISYNQKDSEIDDEIKELEKKDVVGCEVCIQHTLPTNYVYDSRYKNIGYLATETNDFCDSMWHKNINMMDEIWVPSEYVKRSCINSGVTTEIKIVPHCLNVSEYELKEKGAKIKELIGSFNFVFIGEFIERKNIKALLRAFHTEFHPRENVNLYIKTSGTDVNSVQNYCNQIKKGLKLRAGHKNEMIISGRISKEEYISILSQCHCFVMPSRGEGFCIPALESMCIGIPSLYTSGIALEEFAVGESVLSREEPCFGGVESLSNLYTANSTWKEIDILDLQTKMRNQYLKGIDENVRASCIEKSKQFSHEAIGEICKELLND
jgi:glycosyltransferase involved in cell wall biosynthesis